MKLKTALISASALLSLAFLMPALAGSITKMPAYDTEDGTIVPWLLEGFTVTTDEIRSCFMLLVTDNISGVEKLFMVNPPFKPEIYEDTPKGSLVRAVLEQTFLKGQVKSQLLTLHLHSLSELRVIPNDQLIKEIGDRATPGKKNP